MKRGDLVTIAVSGDFGKPRPALLIQSDLFDEHPTHTLLLLTSTLVQAPLLRVRIEPDTHNGLQQVSQIMIDKAMTVRREKIGPVFGRITPAQLKQVERCLALFFGIAP